MGAQAGKQCPAPASCPPVFLASPQSCPQPGPCEPCSRAHTCANIRPPAGKWPLEPSHRCPGLAGRVAPAWPPQAQPGHCSCAQRPAARLWADDPHLQWWRPCSCSGGRSRPGLKFGLCLWQVLDKQSGHASGPPAGGFGARRPPLCGIAMGHQAVSPARTLRLPTGWTAQGLPSGCAAPRGPGTRGQGLLTS